MHIGGAAFANNMQLVIYFEILAKVSTIFFSTTTTCDKIGENKIFGEVLVLSVG